MKLIDDWQTIAKRAHSMWAFYASVVSLTAPELIYLLLDTDTNPRTWWLIGLALLIYGIFGRLVAQDIEQPTAPPGGVDVTKVKSGGIVGFFALTMALIVASVPSHSFAMSPLTEQATEQLDPTSKVVPPAQSKSDDAAFLEIALPFVGRWEGLRLQAYLDIVGVPTVCYGETKGVKLGDSYTKAQCDAMLAREILSYRDRLRPAFTTDTLSARMPVARDVAYTSLAYNVGVAGTAKSTAVRRLNADNIKGGCAALGWWNKAGGRVVRGLVNRRSEETSLCLRGAA